MRRLWVLLLPLLLVAFLLTGAGQWNVDETEHLLCSAEIQDTTFGAVAADPAAVGTGADGFNCISYGATGGQIAGNTNQRNFYVPASRRLVLDSWGVIITAAIAATEECAWQLVADTTTAGTGSLISVISTGATAETECTIGTINLDTAGEACIVNSFTTVIPGGGWWSIRAADADAAGANTCTNWQGGTVWVHGRFSSQ